MNDSRTIQQLNDLLTKSYDAEEGFRLAAERAEHHPDLASFFSRQSHLRRSFGHEIKELIARHGGEPDKGASTAAKVHQVWITVKDILSKDENPKAILEECVRGEEKALEEYDTVIDDTTLPADVLELAARQRSEITKSLQSARAHEKFAE